MDDRTKAIIEKTAYDIDDMAYEISAIPCTWGPEHTYAQGYSAARAEAAVIVRLMLDPTVSFPDVVAEEFFLLEGTDQFNLLCNFGVSDATEVAVEDLPLFNEQVGFKLSERLQEKEKPAPDQWDTELRGPRMSGTTGNRIWKYQMPVLEEFEMDLPAGAEIVRVVAENGMLWAQVSTTAPSEPRKMRAFKAGGTMPDDMTGLAYVGCAPIYIQQELMLYFYEEVSA